MSRLKFFLLSSLFLSLLLNIAACRKNTNPISGSTGDGYSYVVCKSTIYLYPEQATELSLFLAFPSGGSIEDSSPPYAQGWNIFLDKQGVIGGKYRFLWYECRLPDLFQHEKGWIVQREHLADFFEHIMPQYGFCKTETDDFVEYWIQKLRGNAEYLIYPQQEALLKRLVALSFSLTPERLQRVFFVIRENTSRLASIEAPQIALFQRSGFTAVECGGVFAGDD